MEFQKPKRTQIQSWVTKITAKQLFTGDMILTERIMMKLIFIERTSNQDPQEPRPHLTNRE